MDHDQLFKLLLITFFKAFVQGFLPDLAPYLDLTSVEFLDKEIFTDLASSQRHVVDLIVKVRFRNGNRAFFLIHIENQAWPSKDFPRRMFRYFARLYEKHGLPVYPVAIFSYDRPLRAEPNFHRLDFPDLQVLDFRFRTIQLNRLNWRDFLRKPNPVAAALMTRMHIAEKDRPRVKFECMRMLAKLKLDPARSTLIGAFMTNYLTLTSRQTAVYNRMVETVAPEERKVVMQLTNEWIEQGIKQGITKGREEGRQEGLQEGARALILHLLRKRLGRLPAKLARQVEGLDDDAVLALRDAFLDFTTPADAQRWLAERK
jgi:predicted transposase YdaD